MMKRGKAGVKFYMVKDCAGGLVVGCHPRKEPAVPRHPSATGLTVLELPAHLQHKCQAMAERPVSAHVLGPPPLACNILLHFWRSLP